jgi:hypothetical protein
MIQEERIITAVEVQNGAYVDGTKYEELYNKTKECGINIENAYADKAYFRQPIIDLLEQEKVNIYIPVSQSVYKMDESKFAYNKDSDQWYCTMGNSTIKKSKHNRRKSGQVYEYFRYYFEREKCKNCPIKNETGCKNCKGYITDRTQRKIPVICYDGYTELLNPQKLFIADRLNEFKNLSFVTLLFWDETSEEVSDIVKRYINFENPPEDYTRGLYYRGVI